MKTNQNSIKTKQKLISKGRKLAFLLRHDREYVYGVNGWRKVSDLIENHNYTLDELCAIVDENNKQRYEFSDDKLLIRARQGHSVPVDVELDECVPPDVLYHGTALQFLDKILVEGIKPQNRLHVHLTAAIDTALNVGKRHGDPVLLEVNSKKMHDEGVKFYLSRNGVWLTDYVAPDFINIKEINN